MMESDKNSSALPSPPKPPPSSPAAVEQAPTPEQGLSVRLQGALLEMLREIAQIRGVSVSDALCGAITNENFLRKSLRDGNQLLLEHPNQKFSRVILEQKQ